MNHVKQALCGLVLVLIPGCLQPIASLAEEGDASPASLLAMHIFDERGVPWPSDSTPRRPVLRFSGMASEVVEWGQFSFISESGSPEIGGRITHDSGGLSVRPARPLVPGESYLVSWTRELTLLHEARITVATRAGAVGIATWPPHGNSRVPNTMSAVAVRLDDELDQVPGDLSLRDASGGIWQLPTVLAPCLSLGWPDGVCVQADLGRAELSPGEYRLEPSASFRDWTGAVVDDWYADFRVVETSVAEVGFRQIRCTDYEREIDVGCLYLSDTSVTIRLRANGSIRTWLHSELGGVVANVMPAGDGELRLSSLTPGMDLELHLIWEGLGGVAGARSLSVQLLEGLPELYITEVLPDPEGRDAEAEYVEVWNAGQRSLSLDGMRLSDHVDRLGDEVPQGWRLHPGERALLVGESFDRERSKVPAATAVIRLLGPLASGGLANGGERLFLWDRTRRLLSAAPAIPSPGPGRCMLRISSDGRDGRLEAFRYDEEGGCSPGFPSQY